MAPLGHKDISAKIYIMKLPTTAPTKKFSTTTKIRILIIVTSEAFVRAFKVCR